MEATEGGVGGWAEVVSEGKQGLAWSCGSEQFRGVVVSVGWVWRGAVRVRACSWWLSSFVLAADWCLLPT